MTVYHPYYYGIYNFLSRPANAVCDLYGYACGNPVITEDSYDLIRWGPLTAGTSYDVLFDTEDTSIWSGGNYGFVINCPKPDSAPLITLALIQLLSAGAPIVRILPMLNMVLRDLLPAPVLLRGPMVL